jgi:hypothetical protein
MTEIQKELIKHLGTGLANTYQEGIGNIVSSLFEIKYDEGFLRLAQNNKHEGQIEYYTEKIENSKKWIAEAREGLLLRSKEVKSIIDDLEKLFESDL